MHFDLVDRVIEISDERIVTIKQVTAAEEYLQDHFAGFPVLPGVMMIEAMVQAGRRLLARPGPSGGGGATSDSRMVLGGVKAVKYGSFVRPGETLRVEVSIHKRNPDGSVELKGEGTVHRANPAAAQGSEAAAVAVAGRLVLRPIRLTETP